MKKNNLPTIILAAILFSATAGTRAQTGHFHPAFEGKGLDHMNINLVRLPSGLLEPGDEIGVFDGTLCAGAVILLPEHLAQDRVSITASSHDESWNNGFTEGNPVSIKLWKSASGNELILERDVFRGSATFLRHESLFGSLEKYSTGIQNQEITDNQPEIICYPNPFNDAINISINLKEPSSLVIDVFAADGSKVRLLMQERRMRPGMVACQWNGEDVRGTGISSGIYLIRIQTSRGCYYRKVISGR